MKHRSSNPSTLSHIERRVFVAPTVQAGATVRYGDWRDDAGPHTWYDDAHIARPHNILGKYIARGVPLTLIEVATGSDYSGTLVEISNAITLKEKFPWLIEVYGGYGTRGVAYLGKRENQSPGLIEAIDDLTGYPIFDDDHHSHLEMEKTDEAWTEDGRRDFKRALVKYFDAQYEPDEHDLDDVPDEQIDQLWYDCTECLCGGEDHLNESGDQIYFPISDVIKKIRASYRGLDKPSYDGTRPSINDQLLALAESATIDTSTDNTEGT